MQVAYGPPPLRGVTTLMSVGADAPDQSFSLSTVGLTAAMVGWLLGLFIDSKTMQRVALVGGAGALVLKVAGR